MQQKHNIWVVINYYVPYFTTVVQLLHNSRVLKHNIFITSKRLVQNTTVAYGTMSVVVAVVKLLQIRQIHNSCSQIAMILRPL